MVKCELDIEGFEEQSTEFILKLVFISPAAMDHFITFVKTHWEDLYSVELQVNYVT